MLALLLSSALTCGAGRKGTATVEYALLLAVLVIVAVGVWVGLGATIRDALQQVANSFNQIGP